MHPDDIIAPVAGRARMKRGKLAWYVPGLEYQQARHSQESEVRMQKLGFEKEAHPHRMRFFSLIVLLRIFIIFGAWILVTSVMRGNAP